MGEHQLNPVFVWFFAWFMLDWLCIIEISAEVSKKDSKNWNLKLKSFENGMSVVMQDEILK